MKSQTTNVDILGPKKNYQLYCKKCEYKLILRKVTFKYANRNVKRYNKLKTRKSAKCNHNLALREMS